MRSNASHTVIAEIPTHRPSCPPVIQTCYMRGKEKVGGGRWEGLIVLFYFLIAVLQYIVACQGRGEGLTHCNNWDTIPPMHDMNWWLGKKINMLDCWYTWRILPFINHFRFLFHSSFGRMPLNIERHIEMHIPVLTFMSECQMVLSRECWQSNKKADTERDWF